MKTLTIGKVPELSQEELDGYIGMVQKKAVIWHAELVKNPFDLNAMHNLNLLDNMAVSAINRYLNQ
jgi:hypothetical protein